VGLALQVQLSRIEAAPSYGDSTVDASCSRNEGLVCYPICFLCFAISSSSAHSWLSIPQRPNLLESPFFYTLTFSSISSNLVLSTIEELPFREGGGGLSVTVPAEGENPTGFARITTTLPKCGQTLFLKLMSSNFHFKKPVSIFSTTIAFDQIFVDCIILDDSCKIIRNLNIRNQCNMMLVRVL